MELYHFTTLRCMVSYYGFNLASEWRLQGCGKGDVVIFKVFD